MRILLTALVLLALAVPALAGDKVIYHKWSIYALQLVADGGTAFAANGIGGLLAKPVKDPAKKLAIKMLTGAAAGYLLYRVGEANYRPGDEHDYFSSYHITETGFTVPVIVLGMNWGEAKKLANERPRRTWHNDGTWEPEVQADGDTVWTHTEVK
jgi:hypothetical protein